MSEIPHKDDSPIPNLERKIERGLWYQGDPIDSFVARGGIQEVELVITRDNVDPTLGVKPLDKYFAIYVDFFVLESDDIVISVSYFNQFLKKVEELIVNFDSITNMKVCYRE